MTNGEPEWILCTGCDGLVYHKRMRKSLFVCPNCAKHHPLSAPRRLAQLLDPESMRQLEFPMPRANPIDFVDSRPYPDRLAAARRSTGLAEAVRCVTGTIDGNPVVVAAMDFRFLGGSLGSAVGELITRAAETALRRRHPLLIVTASGGARMQEGALALMQMAKTAAALRELDEAGIVTIALVTDPTYGGVAASFATLCDVIIAEPSARFGFAGPRVIEQTIHQRLPDGFQTAEFLLEHGIIDGVCPRVGLRAVLANTLSIGTREASGIGTRLESPASPTSARPAGTEVVTDPSALPLVDAWQTVRIARHQDRPTAWDYIRLVFEDFEQLRGDRMFADCPAVIGGLARLAGQPVMVIGSVKGHTAQELIAHQYGMASPAGYRKAARLMRLAGKLGLPVITLIDTPGAYPGVEAEEHGQMVAIAENLRLMAGLPVPIVAVVTGEGGSGGALALGVANTVLMMSNAVYSVISPEGCASILFKDTEKAPAAAEALRLDARSLLELGIVDGVIREPGDGCHTDHRLAADRLRVALVDALTALLPRHGAELVQLRHARFRSFGSPTPDSSQADDVELDAKREAAVPDAEHAR